MPNRIANHTPVTASGAVSTPGNDFVFVGLVMALTSTGNNDYAAVRIYDGSDATGTLVGVAEVWQESLDHHRGEDIDLPHGVACTNGCYAEVITESSATFKCTLLYY